MKKSKKLLSVLLAVLMLLSSMSVMASAAKATYQTHDDLQAIHAYSPYGEVTRLDTETRMSIILDSLDPLLASANISMGQVVNVLGLNIRINLRSVNELCDTLDSFKDSMNSLTWGAAAAIVNLGILESLNLDSWQSGMTREGTEQLTIVSELLELLSTNANVVGTVLSSGKIDLGLVANFIKGLDLSSVEKIIGDLPGFIKGMIFPLFERKDDDRSQVNTLANTAGDGGLQSVLNAFVKGLFTKPQSTTTYMEDAEGNCISGHKLPTQEQNLRYYYVKSSDDHGQYYECYVYDTETSEYVPEEARFYRTEEADGAYYTYRKATGEALKYYEEGSYWLPSIVEAVNSGDVNLDLSNTSAAQLLYDFIPYVFREMAPVVLNGSVKKLLGGVLGVDYTYIGDVGSEEVNALPDSQNEFFTQKQGSYLWEWSDYAVINGTHYYRFEDQIFKGDTSTVNPFFDLIDWDYEITPDFVDEFIPETADGTTQSAAGYTTVLQGLNDFLVKAANEVLEDGVEAEIGLVKGDNSKLIPNIKKAAQTIVAKSPETIFGAEYNDPDKYYNLIMSDDDQEVLIGIACTVIPMLMPQMILPKADTIKGQGYTIGAVLAAVLRELATQLLPTHNYDALIYSDYDNKTFVAGKTNEYWLDVILTMGTDIGVFYLKNLADMGEDAAAWSAMGWSDSKTYKESDLNEIDGVKPWEAKVDYIVDWALSTNELYSWKFANLVDCGATVDLATVQDPWVKLGNIFKSLLPVKDIFNLDIDGDSHWLETILKDDLVLAIADLHPERISNLLIIPQGSVLRQNDLFTQITTVVRNLLNSIVTKVLSGDLIPASVNNLDAVMNQSNITNVVQTLVSKLSTAYNNHLLDTVLPIVNFFLGWSVDPQEMADPELTFSNTEDLPYMYSSDSATVNTTLNVRNASSGMLLEHPGSDVIDKPYTMYVTSVTSEYGDVSVDGLPMTVEPGASVQIPLSMTYTGDKATSVTISYYYLFKDGKAVGDGSALEETVYEYVSNKKDAYAETTYEAQTVTLKELSTNKNVISVKPQNVPKYRVWSSLSNLNTLSYIFDNVNDQSYSVWISRFSASGAPDYVAVDTTSFVHGTTEIETMKDASHGWMNGDDSNKAAGIAPYSLDVNKDVSSVVSGSVIDLGTFSVTWHNAKGETRLGILGSGSGSFDNNGNNNVTFDIDAGDIYYKDVSELTDVFEQYEDVQRKNYSADADTEWTAFYNAMLAAEAILTKPFDPETFASDYAVANLEQLAENITTTYEALSKKEATATSDALVEALAEAEPGGDTPEINYQDYRLYEYFNYEDYRTAVRDRIKEYQGPAAPEKYIPDSSLWGDATVDEFLASVENEKKKEAITATVVEPTADEQTAYQDALAEWRAPTYSELDNDNQSQLLLFYKQFLQKKTVEKQFLAKEIAYANAQEYSENDYSKDSWAAYQEAYQNAVAVNQKDGALQSEVFDAKYALMKAENELLAAAKSMKDGNTLDNLNALIVKAEDIFQNSANYKVKGEMDETEAYKQLIEALGYKTESGEILYDHSALTFVEYDRETTQNNLDRLANAEAKLQAAINNFESNVVADIFPQVDGTEGQDHNGVVDTEHNDGEHKGYLYGITPGEDILEVFGSHGGTLNLVPNAQGVTNGTGAVVQVMQGEQVVAEYVVIIFGDVNGDGKIDDSDTTMSVLESVTAGTLSDAYGFAADVTGDGRADDSDTTLILCASVGTAALSTNPFKET